MTNFARSALVLGALGVAISGAAACGSSGLALLSEARENATDLHVEFTKAVNSSTEALLSEDDSGIAAHAAESDAALTAADQRVEVLRRTLRSLHYDSEARTLEAFATALAKYKEFDRKLIAMTTENTNRIALRLAFGPALEAADSLAASLAVIQQSPSAPPQAKEHAASAEAAVREIQALEPPHIAESSEETMDRLEARMGKAEARARAAITALAARGDLPRSPVTEAATALERFVALDKQIIALSRRNTNVHALTLAMTERGALVGKCDDSLQQLREALRTHGFSGTR